MIRIQKTIIMVLLVRTTVCVVALYNLVFRFDSVCLSHNHLWAVQQSDKSRTFSVCC